MKGELSIDSQLCKGCALCLHACRHSALELDANRLNERGYPFVQLRYGCVGCAACAEVCPEAAITVYRTS
ncbi:MAG: 4Fe-4S dicluster domain-containing protein [Tannerellaceae bacterium]|jgi:2-oxoglutarate ferredoxin oxidoreductase subunit delta|nr:4Fe-4S dicluster domain-containing protein [Tannerellaceae bacterium]